MKRTFEEMIDAEREREKMHGFEYLMTYAQVAKILNLKENTLRVWVSERKIPFVKLGSAVRFTPEMVQQIIEGGTNKVD